MKLFFSALLVSLLVQSTAQARVELVDRQGTRLDLQGLRFRDETGTDVTLARYFGQRPVIMALVYFKCPATCTVLLNNFVRELTRLQPSSGTDFDVVAVSIDPKDTPELAQGKKANYLKMYGREKTHPRASDGWHFLTGTEANIGKLSEALGFYFAKDEASGVISHPSVLFFLTADGVLSKSVPGLDFSRRQVLAALYGASHGQVEQFFERLTVICNTYLPHIGFLNSPLRWLAILAFSSVTFLFLFVQSLLNTRNRFRRS